MKLTKNQIRFNKELKRIERIAKELGIDTTLVLPKRITESRLKQIGKIKRKNISRYVKDSSPLLTAKSSVDRTGTFLSKKTSRPTGKKKKKSTKEPTKKTTPKQKQTPKQTLKQTPTPTSTQTPDDGFVPAPNPFTEPEPPITPAPTPTPNIPFEGHIEMPTPYEEVEIGQLSPNGLFQYTELGWYNIETGEKIYNYDDLYYKWQIAKEDFITAISRDSHGAEILTRIIGNLVSTYGEQTIFDAMTHLDREFWTAIDTISRYRDADNGDMIINNYDTSVNIELVQHELKSYLERS